jgi:uncharacterized protein with PIN domain
MLFVDSSVILDVITADPHWAAWSATQLAQALDAGPVLISAIVYAEMPLPATLWPTRTTASEVSSAR